MSIKHLAIIQRALYAHCFLLVLLTIGCSSTKTEDAPPKYPVCPATKGVLWLKDNQNMSGGWGEEANEPLLLGLALLAYDSHGETPSSLEFGESVRRALKRAYSIYDKKQNHAILDLAIARYYRSTRIPKLKHILDDVISDMIEHQNPNGKFTYKRDPILKLSNDNAFSQSLNILTLICAYKGGYTNDNPAQEKKIKRATHQAAKYLIRKFYNKSLGGFTLIANDNKISQLATTVATCALIRCGHRNAPETQTSLKLIEGCIDDKVMNESFDFPVLSTYFMTRDIYDGHRGTGKKWAIWSKKYTKFANSTQQKEGEWNLLKANNQRLDFTEKEKNIYSTSIAALTLEIWWMYAPWISKNTCKNGDNDDDKKQ